MESTGCHRIVASLQVALVAALLPGACRGLTLCGDPPADGCLAPMTDAAASGGSGAGGVSSDAGAAEDASSCQPPALDCDGSPLTQCETQTSTDVRHCGACNTPCSGACGRGRCNDFESITAESIVVEAGMIQSTDFLYFFVDQGERAALERVDKRAPERVTTVLENLNKSNVLLTVGVDRVYYLDIDGVWSIDFLGQERRYENIDTDAVLAVGSWLYWFDWDAQELRRRHLSLDLVESTPLLASDVQLHHRRDGILVVITPYEDEASYELHAGDGLEDLQLLTRGQGEVVQLHAAEQELYWLVQDASDSPATRLYMAVHWPEFEAPTLVTTDAAFTSFAVGDGGLIYSAFERSLAEGLRVSTPDAPHLLELESEHAPHLLQFAAGYLWFTDFLGHGLFRVDADGLFE